MKQAVIIIITLFVAKKVSDKVIFKLRNVKLALVLELAFRGALVVLPFFLEMWWMFWINAAVLACEAYEVNSILKAMRRKKKEEMADKADGVAYTLKEGEYKVID